MLLSISILLFKEMFKGFFGLSGLQGLFLEIFHMYLRFFVRYDIITLI